MPNPDYKKTTLLRPQFTRIWFDHQWNPVDVGSRKGKAREIVYSDSWVRSGPEQEESAMEAGSVSSSINTASASALQAQVRARPPEQDEQTQQSQQSQQSQQAQGTQETQSNQSVEESRAADRAQSDVEGSRPTVNANGQTVGTRVNTTA
ncbi:hypothetical protein PROAA_430004 [Candidatus Propionivibrio aalborgensis]|uniref:Uncharacterized protein n=2 Tax=Candidatus Propionivibrio aalborgensis TaxID=1860101 RepID=A0A1A8Y086_9RHOO|nr:hypothetical protein PROAA_430004 [Candidatus Propionivibrio aalborgensis]